MSSYRPCADSASLMAADAPPGAMVLGVPPVCMVAFRAADLQVRGKGRAGRAGAALAVPSAGPGVVTGTLVTFCHPVVTVPAVARRDGTVLAGGWLPDFVRLGELERHIGDGVIEELAEAAAAGGRVPAPQRRKRECRSRFSTRTSIPQVAMSRSVPCTSPKVWNFGPWL